MVEGIVYDNRNSNLPSSFLHDNGFNIFTQPDHRIMVRVFLGRIPRSTQAQNHSRNSPKCFTRRPVTWTRILVAFVNVDPHSSAELTVGGLTLP
jgi:hypothetical protein